MMWEKITEYSGTEYGEDIANELRNEVEVTLPMPTHPDAAAQRHAARVAVITAARTNMEAARQAQLSALQAEQPPNPIAIATLENEITQAAFQAQQPIPVELTADEKVEYDSNWNDY
jgi:biopolymer transport protein ExbD